MRRREHVSPNSKNSTRHSLSDDIIRQRVIASKSISGLTEAPFPIRNGWIQSKVRHAVATCPSRRCLPYEPGLFSTLCTVRADTSKIAQKLTPKRSADGSTFYSLEIKVILLFGLTELKAVIGWKDGVSHHCLDDAASLTSASQEEEIRQVHVLISAIL